MKTFLIIVFSISVYSIALAQDSNNTATQGLVNQVEELKEQIKELKKQSILSAARAICYSALAGYTNKSIIMIPLPDSQADLDAICHSKINNGWHAGGITKGRYSSQNCSEPLINNLYETGYTSYVIEKLFESNRKNYTECNKTNAFICCSPQFEN